MTVVREIIDDTYVYFYSTREEAQALATFRVTKLHQPSQPFEVPRFGWLVRCPDGIYDDHGKLPDSLVDNNFLSFFREMRPETFETLPVGLGTFEDLLSAFTRGFVVRVEGQGPRSFLTYQNGVFKAVPKHGDAAPILPFDSVQEWCVFLADEPYVCSVYAEDQEERP